MPVTAATASALPHRERLVEAMADLVVERGYAAVTVTDVVSRARVSKRTFYEHFAEREDCFIATYEVLAQEPMTRIAEAARDAAARDLGLRALVEQATGAYLASLGERPALTHSLLTQIASAGPRGRAVRRAVLHRFAELMLVLSAEARTRRPGLAAVGEPLALALVGGINELVLDALEEAMADGAEGRTGDASAARGDDPVVALTGPVTDLVMAVMARPARPDPADGPG